MATLTRSEQLLAEKTVCILLLRGTDPGGQPVYAYVGVGADRLEAFMAAQEQERFSPEQYGTVIVSGSGDPSPAIREKMEKEYGFNHGQMVSLGSRDAPGIAG